MFHFILKLFLAFFAVGYVQCRLISNDELSDYYARNYDVDNDVLTLGPGGGRKTNEIAVSWPNPPPPPKKKYLVRAAHSYIWNNPPPPPPPPKQIELLRVSNPTFAVRAAHSFIWQNPPPPPEKQGPAEEEAKIFWPPHASVPAQAIYPAYPGQPPIIPVPGPIQIVYPVPVQSQIKRIRAGGAKQSKIRASSAIYPGPLILPKKPARMGIGIIYAAPPPIPLQPFSGDNIQGPDDCKSEEAEEDCEV